MKHVTKYLNVPLIEARMVEIVEEQVQLTRRKAALRTQLCRLKAMVKEHNHLVLKLEED